MKNKSSIIILSLAATLGLFGGLQEYKYDANGRLSGVSGSTDESYAYDSRGNVAQIKKGGEVTSFEYDAANQLKQRTDAEGVHTFTYDRAGRLTEEALNGQSVARYTYGYLDKVTAVERKGQTTRFRYNADGMLIEKQYPDGKIEKWSWDGLGLVARGDERYINEPHASGGTPVMSLTSKGVRYHTSDYLGTTLCSTDAQGKVTDRYEGTAYGQGGGLQEDPSARFTGKPYDKDLGAFVFPFRNYDAKNVRWMSVDPSGFPDGSNVHVYSSNPSAEIDPLGLSLNTAQWAVVTAIYATTDGWDSEGKYLFERWLGGDGSSFNMNGQSWGGYLDSHSTITSTLNKKIEDDAKTRAASGEIDLKFQMTLPDNGYRTGYELLHGTNNDVGGFTIKGNVSVSDIGNTRTLTYTVVNTWNDIIDPNPTYIMDTVYSIGLNWIFSPQDYQTHLSWEKTYTIKMEL